MSSNDTAESDRAAPTYHSGLDLVTLVGVLLVTAEHYFTLIHRPVTFPDQQSILGPVGVFIFLLMSGYHAAESTHPPGDWLLRRLTRIYPAFWIVLSVAFLAAWVTGVQTFGVWQVLAQFSGFGYFAYGESLILQPTWFLTPLLVCYFAVYLMRSSGQAKILSLVALVGSLCLLMRDPFEWISLSCFAFSIGYFLASATPGPWRAWGMFAAGLLILGISPLDSHASKIGMSCLLMFAGLSYRGQIPGIRRLAERSYEVYLVHGLAFYGALRVLDLSPIFGGIVATVATLILTELLYRFVRWLRQASRIIPGLPLLAGIRASRPPVSP